MGNVLIHSTITLDGFMADPEGGLDWMFGFPSVDEDEAIVSNIMEEVGAVVGGANKTQTVEDGELPYGGMLKIPVFEMTREPCEPIQRDGVTYTFVVDDITQAIQAAKAAAGERSVALLGGSIARQCLRLGLVDEIVLHVLPLLLGNGITLFGGLGERIELQRVHTAAFASETHLRFRVVK